MNIKVGDKVRIKTEEELLAEGWTKSSYFLQNDCHNIHERYCGKVFTIKEIFEKGIGIIVNCEDYQVGLPILSIAEVLPQTFDERSKEYETTRKGN